MRLEIHDVLEKDVGVFKVLASNDTGSSSTSGSVKISSYPQNVTSGSLHPSGQTGLDAIEKIEQKASMKLPESSESINENISTPHFTTDLCQDFQVGPDNRIILNCNVEPKSDPNLKIEWFHNGSALTTGSRVMPSFDFGFVNLTIADVTHRDEGIYTCKASNSMGVATTFSKVHISSSLKSQVDSTTMHPHGIEGLESIGKVEAKINFSEKEMVPESSTPPKFTKSFENQTLEQGSVGHFEAFLEPKDDSSISLEWLFNGKPLMQGKIC